MCSTQIVSAIFLQAIIERLAKLLTNEKLNAAWLTMQYSSHLL